MRSYSGFPPSSARPPLPYLAYHHPGRSAPQGCSLARLGWNPEGLTRCIDISAASKTRPAEEVSFVFDFDREMLVFMEWKILTELYVPWNYWGVVLCTLNPSV